MTHAVDERLKLWVPVLVITGSSWVVLIASAYQGIVHVDHLARASHPSQFTFPNFSLQIEPLAAFAENGIAMVGAMMMPLLIAPVRHIRERSFANRRMRSTFLFIFTYGLVWLAAATLLSLGADWLMTATAEPYLCTIIVMGIIAIWQCSPAKQRCLNRKHSHPALAAFGLPADIACLRFGTEHGLWCVGSCWALMLFPMVVSNSHLSAMALVTLWLISEDLDKPMPPRWCLRLSSKLIRIGIACAPLRAACRRPAAREKILAPSFRFFRSR